MTGIRAIIFEVLSGYFSIVRLPQSISEISSKGCTVITQGGSLVLHALLNSLARRSGLKAALPASSGPLSERSAEYLYWLPIEKSQIAADILKQDPSHRFSTLNIFRSRGPSRAQPRYRMGRFRQLMLIVGCRFLLIIFGKSFPIISSAEPRPSSLKRHFRLDFYRNLKMVRGTPFQSIRTQAKSIVRGAEFSRELRIIAARMGKSQAHVQELARREFCHMAANPRAVAFWFAYPIANFILKQVFNNIEIRGLDKLAETMCEKTVILVPMHRSHFDYVLLTTKLYQANLNPPVVAAGNNLSFWPAGSILRGLGAYFVRRETRPDRIHALLLRRYVTYLTRRGHLQEFFIEGGRSRSGRMGSPKLGLLNTIVAACHKNARRDTVFIPVSITYENVVEDSSYGDENSGSSKKRETLLGLLRSLSLFFTRYGDVYVNFGQPVPLPPNERGAVGALAERLTETLQNESAISLTSLACSALLGSANYGLPRDRFISSIASLARLAQLSGESQGISIELTPSLRNFITGQHWLIEELPRNGEIQRASCLGDEIFYVPGKLRFTADFYRNASMHLLFTPALASMLDLLPAGISAEAALPWYEIFASSHQLPEKQRWLEYFEKFCALQQKNGVLKKQDGVFRFSSRDSECFVPGLLLSSIQALLWIYRNLTWRSLSNGAGGGNEKPAEIEIASYSEFLTGLQSSHRSSIYLGEMTRTEGASLSSLTSALESLKSRDIIDYDELPSSRGQKIALLKRDSADIKMLEAANSAIRRWHTDFPSS